MNNTQELTLVNEDLRKNKIVELISLKESIKDLKINWIDDKEWYKLVYEAKNKVVKARTTIEKEYDLVVEDSKKFINNIKEAKNELLNIIWEEEKRLKDELQKIEDEKERVEQEEKEKAKKIFEERIKKLSEIKCIPDNLFAIWSMTYSEFDSYYQIKFNEFQLKEKIQVWLNIISSCTTLEQLEELHHDETFLETYQAQQFKEAFEKRFNELQEEEKRKQEYFKLQLVNKINSTNNWKELNDLLSIHNDFILNNEDIKNIFDNRKEFLIRQEYNNQLSKYTNEINLINNINELDNFYTHLWFYREEMELPYKQRKQFLEQQEELNKMKAEQEEKRKQEEQQQREKQLQEQKQLQEIEKKKWLYKAEVFACNTQDELMKLFSETKYWDLFDYIKPFFTERKNYILEQEQIQQKQKEFQDYLQSINYNKEDCIIQKNLKGETLIYKLIWKWS